MLRLRLNIKFKKALLPGLRFGSGLKIYQFDTANG